MKIIFLIIIFSSLFFIFGFLSSPNFDFSSILNYSNLNSDPVEFNSNIYLDSFDVESIIHITNENDVLEKRNNLFHFIFKNSTTYNRMPNEILEDINDKTYENISNLKKIDQFTINMDYNVNSISYLFHPKNSNNKLIIYHEGHAGDFESGKNSIEYFIDNGFTVIAFSMPLLGKNSNPVVEYESVGMIKLIDHDQLMFLDSHSFSSMKFFIEPIMISLNYIDSKYNFETYSMVGISGGGWTTSLYSAIDERIHNSFSIAGSYPIFLKNHPKHVGDYEQLNPELLKITNYLDLYILSSVGDNRSHYQIFIKNDSCCFGDGQFSYYEKILTQKIDNLKGNFKIIEDDSTSKHEISTKILKLITKNISK